MMALFMKGGVNTRLNKQVGLISYDQVDAGFRLAIHMGWSRYQLM